MILRASSSFTPSTLRHGANNGGQQGGSSFPAALALLLAGPLFYAMQPSRADAPATAKTVIGSTPPSSAAAAPGKGSAKGNGLGRYFVADAVEAAAPAVVNITVNVRFHAGRWTPTYATQSVSKLWSSLASYHHGWSQFCMHLG